MKDIAHLLIDCEGLSLEFGPFSFVSINPIGSGPGGFELSAYVKGFYYSLGYSSLGWDAFCYGPGLQLQTSLPDGHPLADEPDPTDEQLREAAWMVQLDELD